MKGVEAVGEILRRSGVDVVFCMMGGSNVAWLASASSRSGIRVVKTRHEEAAIAAANGYSRASGKVGVCTVTHGPGFANAVNALISSTRTHVPTVLVVGRSPTANPSSTQHLDQEGLTRLIGAGFRSVVTADDLPVELSEALRLARDSGIPQVVSLAGEVLDADVDIDRQRRRAASPPVDPLAVRRAVDILARSSRPLLVAGQGAVNSGCREELVELADLVGFDVATSLQANRFFAGHPRDLGVCGGWAAPLSHRQLLDRDVILGVGASLNRFTMDRGRISGDAVLIRCDVDSGMSAPSVREPDLLVEGDAKAVVRALTQAWRAAGHATRAQAPVPSFAAQRASVFEVDLGHEPSRGLDLRAVYLAVDRGVPADRIVISDCGRAMCPASALVDAPDAHSWLIGRGWGSVGLGLGMTIGAAVAQPRRRVVLFCGDGGFLMAAAGLDTLRLEGLDNVAIVVMNDGQYGAEDKHLLRFDGPRDIVRHSMPDLVALARAYGGDGVVVSTADELREMEIPDRGLFVVDARLDPEVDGSALDAETLVGTL